ncbi:MAG TPA: hypothetical protein H9829_00275 [Candidatus Tetragenococcus pullicola]|nr:hypothetical protein [Candidatus Tetragenococcus pullicola]
MKHFKRNLFLVLSLAVFAGCSQETSSKKETTLETSTFETIVEETGTTQLFSGTSEESTENLEESEETTEKTTVEALNDFEELQTIENAIDTSSLTIETVTDNSNKRILLFSNSQGNKVYKSIFIVPKRRLKLIDLTNDQLLLNEILVE